MAVNQPTNQTAALTEAIKEAKRDFAFLLQESAIERSERKRAGKEKSQTTERQASAKRRAAG